MNINATIIGQTIAFVIFVLFCMKYIWPPLINIIEEREKKIKKDLMFAENAKKNLILINNESNIFIKKIKKKTKNLINNVIFLKKNIINKAKIEAKIEYIKIIKKTKKKIKIEYKYIYEKLKKKIIKIILINTKKIIEHSINTNINNNIINNIINNLK